ncbi:hypothetical protein HUU39_13490 [candidate division KSB1 bacterium]|nr:hypothetical protein [bacterium]NUM66277.1 hypothetical protein [candidate division KSB1 bacterium]
MILAISHACRSDRSLACLPDRQRQAMSFLPNSMQASDVATGLCVFDANVSGEYPVALVSRLNFFIDYLGELPYFFAAFEEANPSAD